MFGAGPVGCLMAQLLTLAGVGELVVVDIAEGKLAIAREVSGAVTAIAHPALAAELEGQTDGRRFDIVVDCTGSADVIDDLVDFAGPGARILLSAWPLSKLVCPSLPIACTATIGRSSARWRSTARSGGHVTS